MIYITHKLAVTADEYQYIVGEPRERKGRGVELRHRRYYPTMALAIQGAISATLRQRVSEGAIDTLREFIQEEERLQNDFSQKLEPLEY